MKTKFAIAIVGLGLMLALPAAAQSKGEDVYKAKCAMCHGVDGKGQTAMGKANKLRDLGSADVQKASDADLKSLIENGKGKMPANKGKLTDLQISDVAHYVRSFKK